MALILFSFSIQSKPETVKLVFFFFKPAFPLKKWHLWRTNHATAPFPMAGFLTYFRASFLVVYGRPVGETHSAGPRPRRRGPWAHQMSYVKDTQRPRGCSTGVATRSKSRKRKGDKLGWKCGWNGGKLGSVGSAYCQERESKFDRYF